MNRNLVVTLAAEVFDFQILKADHPDRASSAWRDFNQAFFHYMERHDGRQLATVLEASYLADFPDALEAMACALELQWDLADRRLKCSPVWLHAQVRIGVTDNASSLEDNPTVPAVDYPSARLLTPAEPGGICMSARVFRLVRSQLDRLSERNGDAANAFPWRNIGRLWDTLNSENPDIVHISYSALFDARPALTLELFQLGDVYIDYPFESAKFRYEKETTRIYRRFYDEPEIELPHDSRLYHEAISGGKEINRDDYYND
jgi:hypothetical protein